MNDNNLKQERCDYEACSQQKGPEDHDIYFNEISTKKVEPCGRLIFVFKIYYCKGYNNIHKMVCIHIKILP